MSKNKREEAIERLKKIEEKWSFKDCTSDELAEIAFALLSWRIRFKACLSKTGNDHVDASKALTFALLAAVKVVHEKL